MSSLSRPLKGQICLLLSIALGGCMLIGPDFKRPPVQVAAKWAESNDQADLDTQLPDYRDWWSLFNDPDLVRLINLAYQNNLSLRIAGVRVLEARAQLGVAIGEFYPQQQLLSSGLSYNRIPGALPYKLNKNTYWSDNFGAQATWELDFWGKLRRAIESADDAFLASVANYDNALVTLVADVATSYVQIRTVEAELAIAKDNVDRQQKALKIARAKFQYGTATKRDVYQAEAVLGATQASIPQLDIQYAQAKNALSLLLGAPPGVADEFLTHSNGIPGTGNTIEVGIPADLLRRRPDVREAELAAAAQCAQIGFAKADLLPTFVLTGNVATFASNIGQTSLGDVFTKGTLAFSAGPAVQWNILNYGQITNNVRVQDAKFQEALISYQNTVLQAQQEVENGLATFIESRQQVVFLKESVTAATGAYNIAMIQYRQGIADFTTVLTAEQNLLQAQDNLALATGSVALGLVSTYKALGGGWELRDGHDFIPTQTQREMKNRTNWGTLLNPQLLQPKAPPLPSSNDEQKPLVRLPEF